MSSTNSSNLANSWNLPKSCKNSVFTKSKTYELVDVNQVRSFIAHNLGVNYLGNERFASDGYSNELLQIKAYLTRFNDGRFQTSHKLAKHHWGRVHASGSLSLASFRRETRHALASERYVDIDMDSSHPRIVGGICKANGVDTSALDWYVSHKTELRASIAEHHQCDKGVAKTLPLTMMFGGTFAGWVKDNGIIVNADAALPKVASLESELGVVRSLVFKANNVLKKDVLSREPKHWLNENEQKRGVMGLWCQTWERIVQETSICTVCDELKIPLDSIVPSQDGFMVPKKYADEHTVARIVAIAERAISDKFPFEMVYVSKPFDEAMEIPELTPELEAECVTNEYKLGTVSSDIDAAKKIIHMYPHWKHCGGKTYVFDKQTGMWSPDRVVHRRVISAFEINLHLPSDGDKQNKMSYGSSLGLMNKALDLLPSLCIDDEWMTRAQSSSRGYLLFKNGTYCFETASFRAIDPEHSTNGFDPKIAFFGRIHRDYIAASDTISEYAADIGRRLFTNTLGDEAGTFLIQIMARALSGECMKKMVFGVGTGDSGKGVITMASQYALGDYHGTYNGDDLANGTSGSDSGQKQRWMLLLRYKRLVFSNELNSAVTLNGNIIKRMSAGGDALVGREHGGNETSFEPHFTPFLLANDLPGITPCDDAVCTRIKALTFNRKFVREPGNEYELLADPNIKTEVKTSEFQAAFVQLLLSSHASWFNAGKNDTDPDCVAAANESWVSAPDSDGKESPISRFLDRFALTGEDADFVSVKQIKEHLENSGVTYNKLLSELLKHCQLSHIKGVHVGTRRVLGERCRGLIGITHAHIAAARKGSGDA